MDVVVVNGKEHSRTSNQAKRTEKVGAKNN